MQLLALLRADGQREGTVRNPVGMVAGIKLRLTSTSFLLQRLSCEIHCHLSVGNEIKLQALVHMLRSQPWPCISVSSKEQNRQLGYWSSYPLWCEQLSDSEVIVFQTAVQCCLAIWQPSIVYLVPCSPHDSAEQHPACFVVMDISWNKHSEQSSKMSALVPAAPFSHAMKEAVALKPGAERLLPPQQLEPGSLVLLETPPGALPEAPQGLWKPVLVSNMLPGSRISLRNV